METVFALLSIAAALMWLAVILAPWRPWSTREVLDVGASIAKTDLGEVTVVIPARNEAESIGRTLRSALNQGPNIHLIVVDDASTDGTSERAREAGGEGLTIVRAEPLARGWVGKPWALEQGRRRVRTPLTLLLDADIELEPGVIGALIQKMDRENAALVSLMAAPSMDGFWEKLLMPAFIYFFKLLYPFALANSPRCGVAAAAGGCMLVRTRALDEIGGLSSIQSALIDDCALAVQVKRADNRIWLGLTHCARSRRRYEKLGEIWNMVARTAYAQLRFSAALLALCTALMLLAFVVPVAALVFGRGLIRFWGLVAMLAMTISFGPTLSFYGRSRTWALALPATGALFLAMTWTSAVRYWRGGGARWKGRVYRNAESSRSRGVSKRPGRDGDF